VFVVDRSGSMSGEKIEQAREALKFFIGQLKPEDTFNIVAYDSEIQSFRPELQRVDDATRTAALDFATGLYAGGSTNIDGALKTALAMLKDDSRPSYVLFLTDGLPTEGEQNEMKIVAGAKHANQVNARVFSFGVGYDVNSRLLDRLSRQLRGQSVYVRPNENIEAHVAALYKKIGTPLLTGLTIDFQMRGDNASVPSSGISRVYPADLTDLFAGEQLILVGRYRHSGPVTVTISGTVADERKSFTLDGTFAAESGDDAQSFVEKIWATRRIGEIIDQLDLSGHNQELVDELVQLSLKHGIMTPYTSFLANEEVELADRDGLGRRAVRSLELLSETAGESAFLQRAAKGHFQRADQAPAASGGGGGFGGGVSTLSLDPAQGAAAHESEPAKETVRSIGRKTFFRKQDRWQDSTVTPDAEAQAIRIVQFSPEYFELAAAHDGRWSSYFTFSEPLVINLEGKTYRIDPPSDVN
jgi:Ca-activated chloride channel family protein